MSDWICDRVEGWIDLYAAGETDTSTRAAVGRHLQECPACAEAHGKGQQLLGLLDQRFQESERLQRLWSRLEAEPKRARRPIRLALWRAAALAASVLLTFGLFGWLGPGEPGSPPALQLAAVLNPPPAAFAPEAKVARNEFSPKALDAAKQAATVYPLKLGGKSPAEYRAEVRAAARTGLPPPPPAVDLELTIRNPGRDVLSIRLDDPATELLLDLQGPGALDAPAPNAPDPLGGQGAIRLAPGGAFSIPIRQLAYGPLGTVHYLYWTEPGEYTLTVLLRAAVETDTHTERRTVVVLSGPIKILVNP